jgi:hypothetical protein
VPFSKTPEFYIAVKPDIVSEKIIKEDMYVLTPIHCKHKYHYNIVKEEE